jgi:hypothetical protein
MHRVIADACTMVVEAETAAVDMSQAVHCKTIHMHPSKPANMSIADTADATSSEATDAGTSAKATDAGTSAKAADVATTKAADVATAKAADVATAAETSAVSAATAAACLGRSREQT